MKYADLPADIRNAYERAASIDARYPTTAGYYDRTHGDNVARGMAMAKFWRLIDRHGLDAMVVLGVCGNKDFER